MGSGSTGLAAILEDFNFIGVELSEEYLEIAKNRIMLSQIFINAKEKTS
jgi:site-specific DNA-methyltransferase (adenine-specific)